MSPVVAASVLTLLHPALVSLSSLDRSSLCLLQAHKSLDVGPPQIYLILSSAFNFTVGVSESGSFDKPLC